MNLQHVHLCIILQAAINNYLSMFPRYIYNNQLSGTLPTELGKLSALTEMYDICECVLNKSVLS